VLAHVPPAEIAALALALARVLEASEERDAETLAALFERAGELGRASTYYAAAVPRAVRALTFERAESLANKAIELARTDEERAAAYEAAIHFHTDMARFPEAYALTRKGAATLGLELPAKFVAPLLLLDFAVAKAKLAGKRSEHILELPTMPAGRRALSVRLANAGAKAAFQVRPELCVAVCTKLVRLCLTHGNSPDSAIAYTVFGAIFQGGILGRYRNGYDLGRVALKLVDKYENERQRAEVSFVVGYFGTSWLQPAQDAEELWRTAFDAGRSGGDLFHMGCAAAGRMMSFAMRGVDLAHIERESAELCELLARNGLREQLAVVASTRQAARDLRGATRALGSWDDLDYDERAEAETWSSFGARHFAHYCHLARTQSFYLSGRLEDAMTTLQAARRLAAESKGMLHSAEHVFVEALVMAAGHPSSSATRRAVRRAASRLEAWADHCPANFAHKAALVRAESLRLFGREQEALAAYVRAAELAETFGYVHVAGLSHLLRARVHARRGEHALHRPALEAAVTSYRRWGATALAELVANDGDVRESSHNSSP
jgi:predicted ATPase